MYIENVAGDSLTTLLPGAVTWRPTYLSSYSDALRVRLSFQKALSGNRWICLMLSYLEMVLFMHSLRY
jgi:hypothetical protein